MTDCLVPPERVVSPQSDPSALTTTASPGGEHFTQHLSLSCYVTALGLLALATSHPLCLSPGCTVTCAEQHSSILRRSKCSVLEFETQSPTCQLHAACSWGGICSASPQGTKGSHSFICSLSKSCENKPWSSNRYRHHCEHHDRKHSYSLLYFISIISVDQLPGHGQRDLSV